jgi:protein-L-isoaspartate(D-aspartate) O-methyltransferase
VAVDRNEELAARCERMVQAHLIGRGIRDTRVIDAFRRIPRDLFVPPHLVEMAYDDEPLPIGRGQTISQPFLVAEMLAALHLEGTERVLEIGTGSGWSAALLSCMAREVHTVERQQDLALSSFERLQRIELGPAPVHVHCGDGTLGWPESAPYDAIVVAAGGPFVPPTLLSQLAPGGRLLMPVGEARNAQRLVRMTKIDAERFVTDDLGPVRFVPLLGAEGWADT